MFTTHHHFAPRLNKAWSLYGRLQGELYIYLFILSVSYFLPGKVSNLFSPYRVKSDCQYRSAGTLHISLRHAKNLMAVQKSESGRKECASY